MSKEQLYAFPHKELLHYKATSTSNMHAPTFAEPVFTENSGMTLRDYFAAKAMQGLLSSEVCMRELDAASKELEMSGREESEVQPKVISEHAYSLADAMIKARGEI